MEHRFLDPIPAVPRDRYGEKGRAARRLRGEVLAMRLTDRFLQTELPGLLSDPPAAVKSEIVLETSRRLFGQLAERTTCYRELAAGYNRFCDFIDAGNDAGAWSFPAIARAHELPGQRLLRNARWQRNAIALHVLDAAIQRHVASGDQTLFDEPEMLFGLLIVHAATLSAICTPQALKALVLAALRGPEVFYTKDSDEAWVLLCINDARITNVVVGEERQRIERHFLDPLTVSLLARIADAAIEFDADTVEPNRMVGWVNALARRVGAKGLPFSSLQRFCDVALSIEEQYTHIPHALLCAQIGRTATVSVPERHWREVLWCQAPRRDDLEELPLRPEPLSLRAPSVEDAHGNGLSPGAVCTALREAIRKPPGNVTRSRDRAHALGNLSSMDLTGWPLAGRLLQAFYVHHLSYKRNRASSVRTYHAEIGRRLLTAMQGKDAFDPDELDAVYRRVIAEQPSDKQQVRAAQRLTELHNVGRGQFDLPALYEPLILGLASQRHIRAAFICESVFARFLTALLENPHLGAHEIERIAVMAVIVYRAGLRPTEVVGLQIQDIQPGPHMTLLVRDNAIRSNKTENATRTVPLGVLLTKDEDTLVRTFLRKRRRRCRNRPTAALFNAEGSATQPLERVFVGNVVSHTLTGIGHPGVFYDFRHTAISRLFLIGERHWHLAQRIVPFDEKQLTAIDRAVFGSDYERHERYRALAALAGHAAPEITFDHYVHFAGWVVHHALRESRRTYDLCYLANLSGIGLTRLRKALGLVGERDARVHLAPVRPILMHHCRRIVTVLPAREPAARTPPPIKKLPRPSFSLWDTHAALEDWEYGMSVESILFEHGIKAERFEAMLSAAQKFAAYRTRLGTPRLIPPDRKRRKRPLVAPAAPTGYVMRRDAEQLVLRFRDLYIAAGSEREGITREDIRWATQQWLENAMVSEPYSRFADREILRRFLKITRPVIPANRWRIELYLGAKQPLDEAVAAWRLPHHLDVRATRAKVAHTRVAAHLYLKHPNDRELIAQLQKKLNVSKVKARQTVVRRYAAYSAKFVFHMLGIALEAADNTESPANEHESQ
jgi:integrase